MHRIKQVCLIGATFGTPNMGVGALTAGVIRCILEHNPNASISLLDYGKEQIQYDFPYQGRNIPIPLINLRFSKKFYLKNNIAFLLLLSLMIKLIPIRSIRHRLIAKNVYLGRIQDADIVASIAGGDSFSDIYGVERFFYVSLPQLLALLMGKKLVLLPQTLGPFNGTIARFIAKYIMRHAQIVYSRDYGGLEEMRDFWGSKYNPAKLRFCYDVGFVVDPAKPEKEGFNAIPLGQKADGSILVGFNISGLLYKGGYTQDNMFRLKIDYRELIYEVLDFFIRQKKAIVTLVPHVFGSPTDLENDSTACEKIYNELKDRYEDKIQFVKGTYNQNEIKYIIGQYDFFVGSRMHACIAALSQNIPAVAIAYSKKFYGVMETIGMQSLVADPRSMEKEEILKIIDRTFDQRHQIADLLGQKMPHVKETILNLFHEIRRVS